MADTGERLPDFNAIEFDPIKQRALTNILERRLQQINTGLLELGDQIELLLPGNNYAAVNHTHVEAEIVDLSDYLLNIEGESIFDLNDVSKAGAVNGYVLKYNSSSDNMTLQPDDSGGGGGGLANGYDQMLDTGGNQTTATGGDTFRFLSVNTMIEALVIDNDATYGDYLRLTLRNDLIDHDVLTNFVADEHVAHTSVIFTAGKCGITETRMPVPIFVGQAVK